MHYTDWWYAVNALYAIVGVVVMAASVTVIIACLKYLTSQSQSQTTPNTASSAKPTTATPHHEEHPT